MKRRGLLLALVGLAGAVTLVVSLGVAAAGTKSSRTTSATRAAAIAPPAVPNAKAIKAKYGGQSITFIGDSAVGSSHKRDLLLAAKFSKATGIKVKVVPHPAASDARRTRSSRGTSRRSRRPST